MSCVYVCVRVHICIHTPIGRRRTSEEYRKEVEREVEGRLQQEIEDLRGHRPTARPAHPNPNPNPTRCAKGRNPVTEEYCRRWFSEDDLFRVLSQVELYICAAYT